MKYMYEVKFPETDTCYYFDVHNEEEASICGKAEQIKNYLSYTGKMEIRKVY